MNTQQQSINRDQALAIARPTIHALMPEADFIIEDEKTVERDFGWVYFYAPRLYLQTKDPSHMVFGAGPLIVLRRDGKTQFLPTSVAPAKAIDAFDEEWRKANGLS